jgi:hypothetical protein
LASLQHCPKSKDWTSTIAPFIFACQRDNRDTLDFLMRDLDMSQRETLAEQLRVASKYFGKDDVVEVKCRFLKAKSAPLAHEADDALDFGFGETEYGDFRKYVDALKFDGRSREVLVDTLKTHFLIGAVQKGRYETVVEALNDGADPFRQTAKGDALSVAIKLSLHNVARHIMTLDVDPKLAARRKASIDRALLVACAIKNAGAAQWLLDAGANPHGQHNACFINAVQSNDMKLLDVLHKSTVLSSNQDKIAMLKAIISVADGTIQKELIARSQVDLNELIKITPSTDAKMADQMHHRTMAWGHAIVERFGASASQIDTPAAQELYDNNAESIENSARALSMYQFVCDTLLPDTRETPVSISPYVKKSKVECEDESDAPGDGQMHILQGAEIIYSRRLKNRKSDYARLLAESPWDLHQRSAQLIMLDQSRELVERTWNATKSDLERQLLIDGLFGDYSQFALFGGIGKDDRLTQLREWDMHGFADIIDKRLNRVRRWNETQAPNLRKVYDEMLTLYGQDALFLLCLKCMGPRDRIDFQKKSANGIFICKARIKIHRFRFRSHDQKSFGFKLSKTSFSRGQIAHVLANDFRRSEEISAFHAVTYIGIYDSVSIRYRRLSIRFSRQDDHAVGSLGNAEIDPQRPVSRNRTR